MPAKRKSTLGRITATAKRLRIKREKETVEERERRLEDIRVRAILYRAAETAEERERRLEKQRVQASIYRDRERDRQRRAMKEAGTTYLCRSASATNRKRKYLGVRHASGKIRSPTSTPLPEFQIKDEISTTTSIHSEEKIQNAIIFSNNEVEHKLAEQSEIEIDELPVMKAEKPLVMKSEEEVIKTEDVQLIEAEDVGIEESLKLPNDRCIFEKCFGSQNGNRMFEMLKDTYANKKHTNMKILDEEHNFVIAIVSPFMQRIGERLKQSSEIVFVNAMKSSDPLGCRVFIMLTNSFAGGLPLALIVMSPGAAEGITEGVKMVRELVAHTSFGGRGKRGPLSFMIGGESKAERAALVNAFPHAQLLFCQFQMVATMRCCIGKRKFNVIPAHKPVLYHMFKSLVYENDENVFEQKVGEILNHSITLLYPEFRAQFTDILKDQKSWATCHRVNLITRGQNTNSLCAATVKVIIKLLQPLNVQSPVHLLTVLMEDYQQLYIDKLVRIAYFRAPAYLQSKAEQLRKKCDELVYFENDGKVFDPDHDQSYLVDLEIGLCNCGEGANGKMCKHLFTALKNSDTEWFLTLPEKEDERKNCFYMATGRYTLDENGRRLLRGPAAIGKVVRNLDGDLGTNSIEPDENDNNFREPIFVTVDVDEEVRAEWNECLLDDDVDPETIANKWWSDVAEQTSSDKCILDEIDNMLADLKTKAAENPSLLASLKEMILTYKKMNTTTALESAMFCFAK